MTDLGKVRWAESRLFHREGQVAHMRLPKRYRFIVFMPNDTPLVIGIDDPGMYEIDMIALVKDPVFPMLVTVVPEKHTPMFEKMTAEQAKSVLHSAVQAAANPNTMQTAITPKMH